MTKVGLVGGVLILVGTVVSEIQWSERVAKAISRFVSPNYVMPILLVALGLADRDSRWRGVVWALALGVPVVGAAVLTFQRELRRGAISDWHVSIRAERLRPIPIIASILATGGPLAVLYLFDGPRYLLAASLAGFALVLFNLLVTVRWKISQHVSSIALSVTLMASALGLAAAPLLLLIPLVAWARVKVGAHTVLQTVAGGVTGVIITVGAMRLLGLS
jgi:membrane-associated phospholipid phosphatase